MWNLDKIHKVGELIAAAAVVVSLLFVGYEVQQNKVHEEFLYQYLDGEMDVSV